MFHFLSVYRIPLRSASGAGVLSLTLRSHVFVKVFINVVAVMFVKVFVKVFAEVSVKISIL